MALADEILADLRSKKSGGGGPPPKGMKPGGAAEDAKDGGADDAEETDSYGSDEEAIAADIMGAIKSGDNAALAEALKSFIDVCRPETPAGG